LFSSQNTPPALNRESFCRQKNVAEVTPKDRRTNTHMFIGRSPHTHESNMESSQSNYWDKHAHTHKEQNKPRAESRKQNTHTSTKRQLCQVGRNRWPPTLTNTWLPLKHCNPIKLTEIVFEKGSCPHYP